MISKSEHESQEHTLWKGRPSIRYVLKEASVGWTVGVPLLIAVIWVPWLLSIWPMEARSAVFITLGGLFVCSEDLLFALFRIPRLQQTRYELTTNRVLIVGPDGTESIFHRDPNPLRVQQLSNGFGHLILKSYIAGNASAKSAKRDKLEAIPDVDNVRTIIEHQRNAARTINPTHVEG